MTAELFAGLELILSAYKTLSDKISQVKGSSKYRFIRELLILFDIFDEVEEAIIEANNNLLVFTQHKDPEKGLVHLAIANAYLEKFSKGKIQYFRWLIANKQGIRTIDLFSEEAGDSLRRLSNPYTVIDPYVDSISNAITKSRSARFTTSNTNIPPLETIKETIHTLNTIRLEIDRSKSEIRTFVSSNFSIEDAFKGE